MLDCISFGQQRELTAIVTFLTLSAVQNYEAAKHKNKR